MSNFDLDTSGFITIVGPTCVGKSKISQGLIDSFPIEVINVDSFMVYSHFSIGTGRHDVPQYRRRLYGFLNPMEVLSGVDYIKLVKIAIHDILKNGHIPIFEGGSVTYLRFLNETFKLRIIGILPMGDKVMDDNIEDRLDDRLSGNLLDEVREGLKFGYRNSRVLKDDVVYLPLVEFLDGKISLEVARDRVKSNLKKMVPNQIMGYKDFEIEWIQFNNAFQFLSNLFKDYKLIMKN